MTMIDDLRIKMHTEAASASRQTAAAAATRDARLQALAVELAQRNHPELLERHIALYQQRHEQGAELQEARHQLAALRQGQQPADEGFFRRGADLTFRAQWLEDQIAQKDQALAQLDAELRDCVARDAAQLGRQAKAEHNRLVHEREAKKAALIEQLKAVEAAYEAPFTEIQRRLFDLSALTPIDLELVGPGLYRE